MEEKNQAILTAIRAIGQFVNSVDAMDEEEKDQSFLAAIRTFGSRINTLEEENYRLSIAIKKYIDDHNRLTAQIVQLKRQLADTEEQLSPSTNEDIK